MGQEVESFVDTAKITEGNLRKLEKNVVRRRSNSKDGNDDKNSQAGGSQAGSHLSVYSKTSSAAQRSAAAAQSQAGGEPSRGTQLAEDAVKGDWNLLDQYAMLLHKQDSEKQKEKKFSSQKNLYLELSKQVESNKSKNDYIKDEDLKYHNEGLKELELWKIAEEEKLGEIKKKNMIEKEMRDEQLILEKKIKEEELALQKVEEEKAVVKIQKEIKLEEEKRLRKIEAQKAHMAKVFIENKQNKARKEEEARKNMEAEIKALKVAQKAMDEQDKRRELEKAARLDRQKKLLERMKNTVQKQAQAKGFEDESRAAQQKQEADKRALENTLEKELKLKALRMETQEYLLSQMALKDDKKRAGLEFKKVQAGVLEEDTAQYALAEKAKVQASKLKFYQNQAELQAQITEKQSRVKNVEMSRQELAINKNLLKNVCQALEAAKEEN